MIFYWQLSTNNLVASLGDMTPLAINATSNPIVFKRGDRSTHSLYIISAATGLPVAMAAGSTFYFGIKAPQSPSYLVEEDASFTQQADASGRVFYSFRPSFNTDALNAALGIGNATENETIPAELEFRIYQPNTGSLSGDPDCDSTLTLPISIARDINRSGTAVPQNVNPPYPLASQLLTTTSPIPANSLRFTDASTGKNLQLTFSLNSSGQLVIGATEL